MARTQHRTTSALRDHVHIGHDEQTQSRRPHARQRRVGEQTWTTQHRPRTGRPIPDLPALFPRKRTKLVVLLGSRRRRHRRHGAEVVDESVLGGRRRAWDHPHFSHALRDGNVGSAGSAIHEAAGGSFRAHPARLGSSVRNRCLRGLWHDGNGDSRDYGKANRTAPHAINGPRFPRLRARRG